MHKLYYKFLVCTFFTAASTFSAANVQAAIKDTESIAKKNIETPLTEKSIAEVQIYPFGGIAKFTPREEKKFQFYKYIITLINGTDHPLELLLFMDEDVPIYAIIESVEGYGSWGPHRSLPNNRNSTTVIDDN